MEYGFQKLATDSNNIKRALQVQTLATTELTVACPQTQISQMA